MKLRHPWTRRPVEHIPSLGLQTEGSPALHKQSPSLVAVAPASSGSARTTPLPHGGAFHARLSRAAVAFGVLGAVLGGLGLLGHIVGIEVLYALTPGRSPMQPNTAGFLVFAALGVLLQHGQTPSGRRRTGSGLLGAAVLLFGALVCAEYLFGLNLEVDVPGAGASRLGPHPGRPSPITAAAFLALGGAILLFDVKLPRGLAPREWLCLAATFLAYVSLVGHAFGAGALYDLADTQVIGVSVPTGIAVVALGIAGLLERPNVGLMRLVTARGPGGVLLRRLGLTALLAAPLLGALGFNLVQAIGLDDLALVLALGNVLAVSFMLLMLVITAAALERTADAVETSRARVRELLEQAPEGIFVADLAGRYTEVNAAGCDLLDFSREEILGKTILDLIPPEDAERLWQSRKVLLQGEAQLSEWRLRRKDGRRVPVEVTAKILPDGRWQGFVRDISERLELERKLLESRDFLQKVLESSTEYGIVAEDLERRVVLWNEGARRTWGYEPGEVYGVLGDRLVSPGDLSAWAELHARGLEQGTAEGTFLALRKDGTTFSAKVVCTRRLGADNSIAGVLIVARDLTLEQRYSAEQEFLSQVGVELAACLEYRETAACVVQLVTRFLGDFAAIDVPAEGVTRRLRVQHRDPTKTELAETLGQIGPAKTARHPLWTVIESKEPVLLSQVTSKQRQELSTSEEHARVIEALHPTSVMLVPLIARGQLLAVLTIAACHESRTYDPGDLRLALEVARRAALALDNVQLFQQSRLQSAVTTNLAEGVVLVRARDAAVVYANPRFEAMFGYPSGELVGKPVHELNAEDHESPEQRAASIIAQLERTGSWHGEIKNVRKDGTELWCAASISAFDHPEHGKVWIAVHTDVSERKRLEEANARALREKEALLREIHHRVKNNLQVISSLFSLQRSRTSSEDLKQLLDESRTRVQSIALVHEQLYRSADLAVINFHAYLQTLISAIGNTYGAELVRVEVNAQGVVLDADEAVPCALIVCELVSNAMKHAFAGGPGQVWVHAERDAAGNCVLEVADNGLGMPPEFDWTTASSLGLRLVHILARQLRGTLELDRSHGTRFKLVFPPHGAASPT